MSPTQERHTPQLAVNPIAYWLVDGKVNKSKEVFDYTIEVDEPSVDDRFESMRRSYEWAVRCLPPREHTTRD